MFYSLQETNISKKSKSLNKVIKIKRKYNRKKIGNIKNFFFRKLNDTFFLEKENIKKKGISENLPFYRLIENKLEKYNLKKKEENNFYDFSKNVLNILNEKNGKNFLFILNKIFFEKKNSEKLILNFDKKNRKSFIRKKNRINFSILVFFLKREYDKLLEKKISKEIFFEKIYFFLEEFLVIIKFECFEKGLFLENILKTIFYKFKKFIKKIKNFYNTEKNESKSVYKKKNKKFRKNFIFKK